MVEKARVRLRLASHLDIYFSVPNVGEWHVARCGVRCHYAGVRPELYHKLAGTLYSPLDCLFTVHCRLPERS